jgi:hypothetical protein
MELQGWTSLLQMVLQHEVVVIEGASKLKDDVEIIPQAIASEDAQSR